MKLNLLLAATLIFSGLMMSSCGDDDLASSTFNYSFADSYAAGAMSDAHPSDLSATMTVTELESGNSMITVELTNTIDGESYAIHAHDKADAASTPNMTPYNETPNSAIFANMIVGNGGTASVSQETTTSFTDLTTTYEGFFVVHDPLQAINTADVTTYIILGDFAR